MMERHGEGHGHLLMALGMGPSPLVQPMHGQLFGYSCGCDLEPIFSLEKRWT